MNRALVVIALLGACSSTLAMHRVPYPENSTATPDSNMAELTPIITVLGPDGTVQPPASSSNSRTSSSASEPIEASDESDNSDYEVQHGAPKESWLELAHYVVEHSES